MFFPQAIKWLSRLPAPYALGLLWWGEATVLLCILTGGHLLSILLFEAMKRHYVDLLFPVALLVYLVVFYLLHLAFSWNSLLMEGLVNIHRQGGPDRVEGLRRMERARRLAEGEDPESEERFDPFGRPDRIRASAEAFKIRYFVVLPTALVLYLMSFASTIYRIFAYQVQAWNRGVLFFCALAAVGIGCLCFWLLMPHLPGYVSVRELIHPKRSRGD